MSRVCLTWLHEKICLPWGLNSQPSDLQANLSLMLCPIELGRLHNNKEFISHIMSVNWIKCSCLISFRPVHVHRAAWQNKNIIIQASSHLFIPYFYLCIFNFTMRASSISTLLPCPIKLCHKLSLSFLSFQYFRQLSKRTRLDISFTIAFQHDHW